MFSNKHQVSCFGDLFLQRLAELEQEARECGLNMTAICREANVSRASPDRWRRQLPETIQNIVKMEMIVRARQAELAELALREIRELEQGNKKLQRDLEKLDGPKRSAKQAA